MRSNHIKSAQAFGRVYEKALGSPEAHVVDESHPPPSRFCRWSCPQETLTRGLMGSNHPALSGVALVIKPEKGRWKETKVLDGLMTLNTW